MSRISGIHGTWYQLPEPSDGLEAEAQGSLAEAGGVLPRQPRVDVGTLSPGGCWQSCVHSLGHQPLSN